MSTRAFYYSRSGSYNESQGPTCGLGAGKTLHDRASVVRSSIRCFQRCRYVWSYRLLHRTRSTTWRRAVASLCTAVVSDEWPTTLALSCLPGVVEPPRTVASHCEHAADLRCAGSVLQPACPHVPPIFNGPPDVLQALDVVLVT
jgi:hypothetical protein